ncbi:MAG: transposase, partial [Oleiphilaceae bacterium]|nr:transposase [Oleiphilaceae bacterium]
PKDELDKDSVMAIIHHRFHILAEYHRNVMIPVIKEQQAKMAEHEQDVMKRAKRLLTREPKLVCEKEQPRIEAILDNNAMIRQIYEKSQELQAIWKQNPGSRFQEKLQDLMEWCKQAEQSGIACLEEFAQNLRYYSLSPALARSA